MASAATINGWAEDLARSFIPTKATTPKTRRFVEHFIRSIKHHSYARTNQFEVHERLIGLEEKFQVLNRDDLSDALRERRVLLGQHQERWIPDALDLLLGLSRDPVIDDGLEKLSELNRIIPVIPTLKWFEIEADDPIDRKDRMWRQPEYSDFSSDEDEVLASSAATSPSSQKQRGPTRDGIDPLPNAVFAEEPSSISAQKFQQGLLGRSSRDPILITEVQAIREVLFMVQGFPTALFLRSGTAVQVDPRFHLSHLDTSSLHSVLQSAIDISNSVRVGREWVSQRQTFSMMQVLQECVRESLFDFDNAIGDRHRSFLPGSNGVASLLEVIDNIKYHAMALQAMQHYLNEIRDEDAIGCLDILYDRVCAIEICGNRRTFGVFLHMFRAIFRAYSKSLEEWVVDGVLNNDNYPFFIQRASDQQTKSALWHNWYSSSKSGPNRSPKLLAGLTERMLVAGKTQAFLKHLSNTPAKTESYSSLTEAIDRACLTTDDNLLPFAPTLDACINQWLSSHLTTSTSTLQTILQNQLGLFSTLSAFSHLYLSTNGAITDTIDIALFSKIDRAQPSWNDRFLVSDLLEEAFTNTPKVEHERVVIHAQSISSQDMKTARQSVRILENLAIDYILPWPVANVLLPDSLASCRRVSLLLSQIRRAKYMLEKHALQALQSKTTLSSSVRVSSGRLLRPVREAEGVFLTMHTFVTTLYAHLTTCVVEPLTSQFQQKLTGTIDEMIALHTSYLQTMEMACLTARNLRILRETVVEVLDLCLKFSFSISGNSKGFDVDALTKVTRQARKQIDLLTTGLRGVARSTSTTNEATELLELLADRVESCGFKP